MADLFKSKKQQYLLIIGYVKQCISIYIHIDIICIIYMFYYKTYDLLESMDIDYYGLESAISKLLRYTISFDYASSKVKPCIIKYRPKCILLYGRNGNRAFHIASQLSKVLTDQHVFVEDLSLLINAQRFIGEAADEYRSFCVRVNDWKNKLNQKLGIIIIKGIEEYHQYTTTDYKMGDWSQIQYAIKRYIMDHFLRWIQDIECNILLIGIAKHVIDLNIFPTALLKHNRFDCQIKIGLSETVIPRDLHKQKILKMEVPFGIKISFMDECDYNIYHYSFKLTEIIEFGQYIANKMNKISMLIYGDDKCGKTSVASYIALKCKPSLMVRLSFDESINYNETYDYKAVIKYVSNIFDIAYNSNRFSVIIIDDFHTLLTDVIQSEFANIPKSNPILIALLALMKRRSLHSKLFVIATCKYNEQCSKLNINQYFDFVRCLPDGLIKSRKGIEIAFNNNGICNLCVPDLKTILDTIESVVSYNKEFCMNDLWRLCNESKWQYGYVDAVWLIMRNLPFLLAVDRPPLF